MSTIDRRRLLGLTAGAGLTAALAGCSRNGPELDGGGGNAELSVSWYGGAPVHEAMNSVLRAWSATSGVTATGSGTDFAAYWDRLGTETAAGSPPDVFRMSMTYFVEYASRGALADVGALSGLDLSAVDADVRDSGLVDGTLSGVGQSSIAPAIFSSTALVEEIGATVPDDWTWPDYESWVTDFATETGKYGTTDLGGNFQMFDVFVRQEGGNQFDPDGTLLVTADLIEAWFARWDALRRAKAVPPADVTAASSGFEENPMSKGDSALTAGWVQQVSFYAPLVTEGTVKITPFPQKTSGDHTGLFVKALDFWCISSASESPEAAAELVNHLINDAEATDPIGLLLGVPPTEAARDQLRTEADEATTAAIDYIETYSELAGPGAGPWPTGYGELLGAFTRGNESVGFGDATPAAAAQTFLDEAQRALGR